MDEQKIVFQGECQLAGWSESHTAGCKIDLWLRETEDLDAFRAMTCRKGKTAGQRLAIVIVEIGDDEQPVEQPPAVGRKHNPLTKSAGILCAELKFQRFVAMMTNNDAAEDGEEQAAEFVREWCGVTSRAQLDETAEAGRKFAHLMAEYRAWLDLVREES
jgi:hypothetical protein